jgi:hypothetical protein
VTAYNQLDRVNNLSSWLRSVGHSSQTLPFAGRQMSPLCSQLDYKIHWPEPQSAVLTAAAKVQCSLLAVDASDDRKKPAKLAEVKIPNAVLAVARVPP